MGALGIRFWLRLGLFVTTLFIVINYLFGPPDNQCQMTFMMEPPKFIPIQVQYSNQESSIMTTHQNTHDYKLYMYSEYGFPQEANIKRDLKDSMPVLFIPGNAGSYQQVRSLASTCIRHQLQSLDAFKFVFYTIDFQAQLSGLSGDLIDRQIRFVHSSVKKIAEMHPAETNGVVVVGHSVGGFIAKALLANPDFYRESIPLLISLGSPLTKPFLNFDSKLHALYESTDAIWKQGNTSDTLSISISGGTSDRLVPMHLSLDTQYDISIATSSIEDVWLTTDHVSITWCRELMTKLVRLLSALMDKKHTRLMSDKEQQMAIARDQLVTSALDQIDIISAPTNSDLIVISAGSVEEFSDFFVARRNILINTPLILNLTNHDQSDLFVWIEHIDAFKKGGIFGCQTITLAAGRSHCLGRINFSDRTRTIPSRRYELKKKSFSVEDKSHVMNYLIIDYTANSLNGETAKYKIPEFISVQSNNVRETKTLYIPTLVEYLFKFLLNPSSFNQEIEPHQKQQVTYIRYELTNLNEWNRYFSISIESKSCATSAKQGEITALLIQDFHVASSFHPKKGEKFVIVKLDARKFILFHNQSTISSKIHMDFFADGSCRADLKIRLDLWGFIEAVIQNHLSDILALSTVILSTSAAFYAPDCSRPSILKRLNSYWLIFAFISYDIYPKIWDHQIQDSVIKLGAIILLANGLIALIDYSINRLVDLATIVNKFHQFIRHAVSECSKKRKSNPEGIKTENGIISTRAASQAMRFDYEWLVVVVIVAGSIILSVSLMKLYMFFMLLRLKLKLSPLNSSQSEDELINLNKEEGGYDVYQLTSSLTNLCALGLICFIPSALIKMNSINAYAPVDFTFITMTSCMIVVKLICQNIGSFRHVHRYPKAYAHFSNLYTLFILCALAWNMVIESKDIRMIIYVEALVYGLIMQGVGSLRDCSKHSKKRTE